MPTAMESRYRLDRRLGITAFSEVYLAFDRIRQHPVAIKRYRADAVPDALLQREFRILSRIESPQIVKVFDLHLDSVTPPMLVMEYLQGPSLRSVIDGGGFLIPKRDPPSDRPFAFFRILGIILEIAAGLRELHSRKLLHGDLKPDNILFRSTKTAQRNGSPRVCLVDFEFSRPFRGHSSEFFSGTFRYASPEQISGEALDARSELFSLGLIFFELLTGRHPFDGIAPFTNSFDRSHFPAHLPGAFNPHIPADVDQLVRRLLQWHPEDRYQRTGDLMADIIDLYSFPGSPSSPAPASVFHFNFGLAGRSRPFRQLRRHLRLQTRQQRGGAFALFGPTGSGKSRLLRWLTCEARSKNIPTLTVQGTGGDDPASLLFSGLQQELESQVARPRPFPDSATHRPGFPDRAPTAVPLNAEMLEGKRYINWSRWIDCLVRFAKSSPSGHLFLQVERIENSSSEFLDFLQFLIARIDPHPITVLLSWDTDRNGMKGAQRILSGMAQECVFSLAPLRACDVLRSLQSLKMDMRSARFLARTAARRTSGNLFLLEEFFAQCLQRGALRRGVAGWMVDEVRLPEVTIPDSLIGVFQDRFRRLPKKERDLLTSLCTLGVDWDRDHLSAAFPSRKDRLGECIDSLVEAGFIRPVTNSPSERERYELAFPALACSIRRRSRSQTRTALHLRFARILAASGAGRRDQDARIGHHFWEARSAQGIPFLIRAGMRCHNVGDLSDAEKLFSRALDLRPSPPIRRALQYRLGDIAIHRGQYARGLQYLRPLTKWTDRDRSGIPSAVILLLRIAEGWEKTGEWKRADQCLRMCRRQMRRRGEKSYRTHLAVIRARVALRHGNPTHTRRILRTVGRMNPRSQGNATNAELQRSLGSLHLELGESQLAIAAFRNAVRLSKRAGDRLALLKAYNGLASGLEPSRSTRAERVLRSAERIARQAGVPRLHAALLTNLARTQAGLGQWDSARDAAGKAVNLFRQLGLPEVCRPLLILGNIHRDLGDVESAHHCYRDAMAACQAGVMISFQVMVTVNHARLIEVTQTPRHAMNVLERHRHLLERSAPPARVAWLLQAAHLSLEMSNLDRARKFLDQAHTEMTGMNSLSHIAREHILRGRWLRCSGQDDAALDQFRSSLRAANNLQHPHLARQAEGEIESLIPSGSSHAALPIPAPGSQSQQYHPSWIGDSTMSLRNHSSSPHLDKLAQLFRSFRDYDSLLEQALDCVLYLTGAERGLLFLTDEVTGELRLVASRRSDRETVEDAAQISRKILLGSVRSDAPILSTDAMRDDRFRKSDSVAKHRIRSFLCAPMWFEGKITGTIYLDHREERKPFDPGDADTLSALASFLAPVLVHARWTGKLKKRIESLQQQASGSHSSNRMIGHSSKILEVFRLLEKVKDTSASVLILGETGTGKELLAKTIHRQGSRHLGPFAAVNCAAIPDTLIESELFGIVHGAATDVHEREGKFEEANGGIIFLDEIGDLSLNAQAKVLRTLQEREIRRVGSNATVTIDVQVISATNRDLEGMIGRREFREDLFFRLNVIPIRLPALRERGEDIPELMAYFTAHFCETLHRPILHVPEETVRSYQAYSWPGNVRELCNVIEREVILAESEILPPLPQAGRISDLFQQSLDQGVARKFSDDSLRTEYTRRVLAHCDGHRGRACEILNIDYKTLKKRLGDSSPARNSKSVDPSPTSSR